jgi:hypothetical protein
MSMGSYGHGLDLVLEAEISHLISHPLAKVHIE